MGSSRGTSTNTSQPVIPPEYLPLVQTAVPQLQQVLGVSPLPSFATSQPLQIAPESRYTQMAYNQLPMMQGPLPMQGQINAQLLPQIGQINQTLQNPFRSNPYL